MSILRARYKDTPALVEPFEGPGMAMSALGRQAGRAISTRNVFISR
jgi:hypothetical protein